MSQVILIYGMFEEDQPISHSFGLSGFQDYKYSFWLFSLLTFALKKESSFNYPVMNAGLNHLLPQNISTSSCVDIFFPQLADLYV